MSDHAETIRRISHDWIGYKPEAEHAERLLRAIDGATDALVAEVERWEGRYWDMAAKHGELEAEVERLQEALRIAETYVLAKQRSEKEAEKHGPMPSWYRAQTDHDLSVVRAALTATDPPEEAPST